MDAGASFSTTALVDTDGPSMRCALSLLFPGPVSASAAPAPWNGSLLRDAQTRRHRTLCAENGPGSVALGTPRGCASTVWRTYMGIVLIGFAKPSSRISFPTRIWSPCGATPRTLRRRRVVRAPAAGDGREVGMAEGAADALPFLLHGGGLLGFACPGFSRPLGTPPEGQRWF